MKESKPHLFVCAESKKKKKEEKSFFEAIECFTNLPVENKKRGGSEIKDCTNYFYPGFQKPGKVYYRIQRFVRVSYKSKVHPSFIPCGDFLPMNTQFFFFLFSTGFLILFPRLQSPLSIFLAFFFYLYYINKKKYLTS